MKNLGFKLKRLREARGISIEKVSEDTRVNFLIIKACEEGRTDIMGLYNLIRIAKYFGVTTDYLLGL